MTRRSTHGGSFWRSRSGPVFIGFALIAAFYLVSEHTAHTLGVLPFLVILVCPLLQAMYVRLARHEEREVLLKFGEEYARYAALMPGFLPRLRPRRSEAVDSEEQRDAYLA